MDGTFLDGLKEIRKTCPNRAVEGMFRFLGIDEDMGLEALVESKRALDLFRSSAKMEEAGTKILDRLDEVLIAQVAVLHKDNRPAFMSHLPSMQSEM